MEISGLAIFALALLIAAGSPGPSVAALVARVLAVVDIDYIALASRIGSALRLAKSARYAPCKSVKRECDGHGRGGDCGTIDSSTLPGRPKLCGNTEARNGRLLLNNLVLASSRSGIICGRRSWWFATVRSR